MFVVTGTPRAATGYMALLFRALGIPCTHEQIFRPRACLHELIEWFEAGGDKGESSWLAWVYLPLLPKPIPVLQVVRNPWSVVDSLAYRNDILHPEANATKAKQTFRDMIRAYCPEVYDYDSAVDRAAAMTLAWNHRIERPRAAWPSPLRVRVEDLDRELVEKILGFLDIYRDVIEIDRALAETPRNVNAGRQIEYNVEVTQPLVRAYLKEVAPEHPPVIHKLMSSAQPKTPDELERDIDPVLCDRLGALAAAYGYSREETERQTAVHNCGEMNDVSSRQCQTV